MLKTLEARQAATGEQRQSIGEVLNDNPSLRSRPAEVLDRAYQSARLLATKETGIAFAVFPEAVPFTLKQVLDLDFLPDEPSR